MFYYNVMIPQYPPVIYPAMYKGKKKKKKATPFVHSVYSYKKKRYSFAYYLKYVLWRKLRRYWKRKKSKCKKKKRPKSSSKSVLGNPGSEEKIAQRDFWGSRYGSQWLFAKAKLQEQQANHHRLIEIVDAFKTMDLKYASKRHAAVAENRAVTFRQKHRLSSSKQNSCCDSQLPYKSPRCPCTRRRGHIEKSGFDTDDSDWSLSTLQFQHKPYSRWPPHVPSGARHYCGKKDQLATILARQHAYVYNWLHVDQLQSRCHISYSRDYLDKVQARVSRAPTPRRRKDDGDSQVSCSCSVTSDCWSTLSRRERAKVLKRQTRAKEKASILWLLSKAFEGVIPNDLREPFYRDQDRVRRLKPKIVHSLANAELYCLALVNIYADPNYHNLDHQGIVQALMRKGICLMESRDAPLTETTLVQTAPIRLNAHMAVIDGIMSLFIKEVLIPEKIVDVVKKFSSVNVNREMPSNSEEAAVLWINKCCRALEQEIKSECNTEEGKVPKIPVVQEISDISDGCSLAAVICYYCPSYFRWQVMHPGSKNAPLAGTVISLS
ncbi:uncharacterized protein LOC118199037 [Stegodyphus dumicola]|uniref:uncharacterized protein LOC118199037 n=1 Tax=Stegodyphus dumicola TaxID=202533 RepID=UPI0015B1F639|nr:uncharacterized protein LOC118199037 [Stegodyphus dumicola]